MNDDYNPEEAVRRFPANQRFGNNPTQKSKEDFEQPPKLKFTPEDILEHMTRDRSVPEGFLPLPPGYPRPNESQAFDKAINDTLARMLNPPEVWIFGEKEDAIVLPLLLSAIGICAVVGNVLVLLAFFSSQRMRSGQNLMLVNVSVADLLFILVTVPVAILNHSAGFDSYGVTSESSSLPPPQLCRFVHYVIFVGVYVSVYTLVVTCVFRFFSEFMRGLKSSATGHSTSGPSQNGTMFPSRAQTKTAGGGGMPPLTLGNAALSCAVIWIAFMTSHLNFLIQKEGAIFEEPFICEHYDGPTDTAKLRTLWVTFLTCAFLLPLIIVITLSLLILRGASGKSGQTENVSLSSSARRLAHDSFSEPRGPQHGRAGSYSSRAGGYRTPGEDNLPTRSSCSQDHHHHYQHHHPRTMFDDDACSQHNGVTSRYGDLGFETDCCHVSTRTPHLMGNGPDMLGDECCIISTDVYEGPATLQSRRLPSEEPAQKGNGSDPRSRRELTLVVMASTIARCICWLPIQIFLLVDVFTPGPIGPFGASIRSEAGRTVDVYRKAEMLAVCFAFASTFINPIVYQCACTQFRKSFSSMFSRCCCCCCYYRSGRKRRPAVVVPACELIGKPVGRSGDTSETIMSILSDSSNRINYA